MKEKGMEVGNTMDEQQTMHRFCHHDFPILETRILELIFDTPISLIPSSSHGHLMFKTFHFVQQIAFKSTPFFPTPYLLLQVNIISTQNTAISS